MKPESRGLLPEFYATFPGECEVPSDRDNRKAHWLAVHGLAAHGLAVHLWAALLVAVLLTSPAAAQTAPQVSAAGLAAILTPPLMPAAGAAHTSVTAGTYVTVIEYFDYNCPVCRRMEASLQELLARDAKVRLIYKDWPIFGAVSAYAAYCSFAAAAQGQYSTAHHALMNAGHSLDTFGAVNSVLREAGLDVRRIDSDIARHRAQYSAILTRNQTEADALNLAGTPGLIIGDRLIAGGLDVGQLQTLVAAARKRG